MKAKKNPKISIERKRGLLFQIGLVITLLVVLVAFEWKSYEKTDYSLGQLQMDDLEDEMIPITRQEEKPPPPPPPPPEIIEIVEDEVEIENELEVEDTDTDENEFIEQEEEEDSDEVFLVVEQMPVFPGGDLGLMKFIQKTTKYPPIAKENDITGKVYVSYVVNKKGKVTNVKVVSLGEPEDIFPAFDEALNGKDFHVSMLIENGAFYNDKKIISVVTTTNIPIAISLL